MFRRKQRDPEREAMEADGWHNTRLDDRLQEAVIWFVMFVTNPRAALRLWRSRGT